MQQQSLNNLAELLEKSEHIAVLTGAGMSTESGIPDFRSASGLWTQNMSLADAVSIDYFRRDPIAFWRAFKSIFGIKLAGNYVPNQGHYFLVWLESLGKRITVLTQNIDGLHCRAGSKEVIELHGTLLVSQCLDCGAEYQLDFVNQYEVPKCIECGSIIKPRVVLYGEAVPHIEQAFNVAAHADCLLVMGSSLEVSPVNYIPMVSVENGVNTALINLTPTRMDTSFNYVINAAIGDTCTRLHRIMSERGLQKS